MKMNGFMAVFNRAREVAQSAAELAIFGGILIFVIGSIARTGLSQTSQMNIQLQAMRIALSESYKTAEGAYAPGTQDYFAARNNASIFVLEDRLGVDVSKPTGSRNREPTMYSGSGTFSKNMFFTPDAKDATTQVPIYDVIVNGQHFPLTTAGVKAVIAGGSFWTVVANGTPDWCAADPCSPNSADERFDLNRDGTTDVAMGARANFAWQWMLTSDYDPEKGKHTSVDVDGDLKEEQVFDKSGNFVLVMDSQEGDIDGTLDKRDPPGIKMLLDIESYMKSVDEGAGTSLRVQEIPAAPDQYLRSDSAHQHSDLIERLLFLNPKVAQDPGRFCNAGVAYPTVAGMVNPVKYCSPGPVCVDCFSSANPACRLETCMDTNAKVIFVRSQIRDIRGRRWVTKVTP